MGEIQLAACNDRGFKRASRGENHLAVGGGIEPRVIALGELVAFNRLAFESMSLACVVIGHNGASSGSSRTRIVASATPTRG